MSVGFGFSAGDFIAALQLVGTVIDALRNSGDSSTEYRTLIEQLYTLQSALLGVKRLELDDSHHEEVIALRQAAAQCQTTIDTFWEKIKKYQPSLQSGGTGSRVTDGWRKVKWAVCKKEDIVRFRAELMAHTEGIDMILTTVQMAATRIDANKNKDRHKTLAGKIQDSYFGCMQKMSLILETASTGIRQGKQLLEMTAKVIQTNVQIFQIVLNLQAIITQIPNQIKRQQPVNFIDALGQHTPFHLEFITSAEALKFVLQCNVRGIGSGATKIADGEFAIQDLTTKRDVDLQLPWKACFHPGQQVAMSMIFNSEDAINKRCPKCRDDNGNNGSEDEDVECRKCKMVYRRSISRMGSMLLLSSSMMTGETTLPMEFQVSENVSSSKMKRKRSHDEDYEMTLFRRVRIKTLIELPAPSDPRIESNIQQTSSYWSVYEQTHFPTLLQYFGTDWHGIAKTMRSKTHIMVKNYYQRQVNSGKMGEWEELVREADGKRGQGESPYWSPTLSHYYPLLSKP
ncbi:vegetative cell wall protein gp1 [Phlyctema vagabunda]|uniref:Vegetative cell wall protein gp1 n=1 Tax=Phlyctema vagabunda TaxID=108571 RepID=A0ABR4P3V2_9HELO